jgi:cystathionine beta-lyase
VVVCAGATSATGALIAAWTAPGDAVLVPELGFPGHRAVVSALGRRPVEYPLPEPTGAWLAELDRLAGRACALVWLSPHNPTGAVPDEEVCRAVAGVAGAHGLALISDEVHHDLVWHGRHASPLPFCPSPRRAAVWSGAKSLRLAQWRIGAAACYAGDVDPVIAAVDGLTLTASLPAQAACRAALDAYDATLRRSRRHLLSNLRHAVDVLGAPVKMPDSGMSLWLGVAHLNLTGARMVQLCQERSALRVWPGDRFGASGRHHVRVSLGIRHGAARTAVRRLADLLDSCRADRLPC